MLILTALLLAAPAHPPLNSFEVTTTHRFLRCNHVFGTAQRVLWFAAITQPGGPIGQPGLHAAPAGRWVCAMVMADRHNDSLSRASTRSEERTGAAPSVEPGGSDETRIIGVQEPGDLAAALAIREIVFIEEQAVPQQVERDDEDEAAFHLLAVRGGHAIGTGRLATKQVPPDGETGSWGRIGRMAVLASHRRGGVGRLLLRALEQRAREQGLTGIVLHAQVISAGFYEHEGYVAFEAPFEEAGMPHVRMSKKLAPEG